MRVDSCAGPNLAALPLVVVALPTMASLVDGGRTVYDAAEPREQFHDDVVPYKANTLTSYL
eukprot:1194298-Prorocentrum_minimum.AAC.2